MSDEKTEVPVEVPAAPEASKKLSEMETLKVNSLGLRHENLALKKQHLQRAAQDMQKEEQALRDETMKLRVSIAEAYGLDVNKMKFLPDGTVTDKD